MLTVERDRRSDAWSIFDDWLLPDEVENSRHDWNVFGDLVAAYQTLVDSLYEDFNPLLERWDEQLADLGGDPTREDWAAFRPLRLTREEDWSDWLAHLLATSETGVFANSVLGIAEFAPPDYARPRAVEREVSCAGYRADVIVTWQNGCRTHVEVKVGDENLSKTFKTCAVLRDSYLAPKEDWTDFILLLANQLPHWERVRDYETHESRIETVVWDDVCIGLRKGLLATEGVTWKVFARSFLGAIEQLLVGFPGHRLDNKPREGLGDKIRILSDGIGNE